MFRHIFANVSVQLHLKQEFKMPGKGSLLNPSSTDRLIHRPIRDLVHVPAFKHQTSKMPRNDSISCFSYGSNCDLFIA